MKKKVTRIALAIALTIACSVPSYAIEASSNSVSLSNVSTEEESLLIPVNFTYGGQIIASYPRMYVPGLVKDETTGAYIGNYSAFNLSTILEGYKLVNTGNFLWEIGSVLNVEVVPEAEDKSINYILTYAGQTVKSGNYTICGLVNI